MNIAFESSALHYELYRGIGKYSRSHIENILKHDSVNNYFIFDIYNDYTLDEIFSDKQINIVHYDLGRDGELAYNEFLPLTDQLTRQFVRQYDIDIFYITDLVLPGYRSPFSSFLKSPECKVFIFLYDIIPYVFSEHYLSDRNLYDSYMECISLYQYADMILADSNSAKKDLQKVFDIPDDKFEVVYAGVDDKFCCRDYEESANEQLRRKYHITGKFIMSVAGDDWRKNIDGMIRSYCLLPAEVINEYQLVFVCNMSESSKERYFSVVSDKTLIERNRIIFTGFVSDQELVQLYNLSDLVIFASKYEGFGLPVAEAWACGAPVVTSDNSSLYEIAHDAAVTVSPESLKDMKNGIEKALAEDVNADLRRKGKEKISSYTWDKNAIAAIDTFSRFSNYHTGSIETKKTDDVKKKVAFFTPLPPLKSGISDYSEDIINEISRFYDIDVFIDDDYTPEVSFPENVRLLNHQWYNPRDYFRTVYQVGNSEFHCYMFKHIRDDGNGIVVLHDINLEGVLGYYCNYDNEVMRPYLLEDFDNDCIDRFFSGELIQKEPDFFLRNPINGFITNYASHIIVHSEYGKEKLLTRDISKNVTVIPHYSTIEEIPEKSIAKKELHLDEDSTVISTFGHIQHTKRIIPILKAYKRILDSGRKAKLVLVGKPADDFKENLNKTINELNISGIKITGYTDLDDFIKHIAATDICVNLRFPYNGETSGSLMRILAKGKPSVINNIGSFSEIPDNACFKIPSVEMMDSEEEVYQIEKALAMLIDNEKMRENIEINARHYAETQLSIDIVGEKYRRAIDEKKNNAAIDEAMLYEIKQRLKNGYSVYDVMSIARTISFAREGDGDPKERGIVVSDFINAINSRRYNG